MLISQSEADIILEPYKESLRLCVSMAWRYYNEHYGHVHHLHTPRTRASILHDLMVHNARKNFEGKPGIEMRDMRGLFLLIVDGQLLIRFKKLDEDKMSRSIPTRQTEDFLAQMDLPGMPPRATAIIVGYELNRLQTEMAAITVTCPNGSYNAWYFELSEGTPSAEVVELPVEPKTPSQKRIRVKKDKKDLKREESNG